MFGANRKKPSLGIVVRQSLVMLNNDPRNGFFYPYLTSMKESHNFTHVILPMDRIEKEIIHVNSVCISCI